jgi:GrpB-like predicted nucleotidyltransferase (UPF0157 family)
MKLPGSARSARVAEVVEQNVNQFEHDNPEWMQVFEAVESLNRTLLRHDLLQNPDVAHGYVVLQEALSALAGDELVANYWRARKALILRACPAAQEIENEIPTGVRQAFYRQVTKEA